MHLGKGLCNEPNQAKAIELFVDFLPYLVVLVARVYFLKHLIT